MLKTSKICKICVFIVFVQDHLNRTLGRVQGGTQSQSHAMLYKKDLQARHSF